MDDRSLSHRLPTEDTLESAEVLAMSEANNANVLRPRSVSPLEDLVFGVGKGRSGSYEDRDEDGAKTGPRGSSPSPSTLVSKKISSRPTTPSGGKRRACIVHLDGCRYTIGSSTYDILSDHYHLLCISTDHLRLVDGHHIL